MKSRHTSSRHAFGDDVSYLFIGEALDGGRLGNVRGALATPAVESMTTGTGRGKDLLTGRAGACGFGMSRLGTQGQRKQGECRDKLKRTRATKNQLSLS